MLYEVITVPRAQPARDCPARRGDLQHRALSQARANEMPDPISREFRILINEMQLGISTEEALTNLSERVENEDLELLVTAVLIQRQIGGNLSEILDNISSTIRGRVKLKGEISALTAQGRMSGIIVSLLPFALAGLLIIINPTYFTPMISNPIGIIMMLVGIVRITSYNVCYTKLLRKKGKP